VIALGFNAAGYGIQYGVVEPVYFLLLPGLTPEIVGLSLEERRYLEGRRDAWVSWAK
jgi:hypothetical protein